jgi:transposase
MPSFSLAAQKALSRNPNVQKVGSSQILFTGLFKIQAVKLNLRGKSPSDIFNDHGIDTALFLDDYPKKSVSRWRKIYEKLGEAGLLEERRGKGSKGRPKRKLDARDPEALLARIAYLEAENFIIKKLNALVAARERKKNSK